MKQTKQPDQKNTNQPFITEQTQMANKYEKNGLIYLSSEKFTIKKPQLSGDIIHITYNSPIYNVYFNGFEYINRIVQSSHNFRTFHAPLVKTV